MRISKNEFKALLLRTGFAMIDPAFLRSTIGFTVSFDDRKGSFMVRGDVVEIDGYVDSLASHTAHVVSERVRYALDTSSSFPELQAQPADSQ